VTGPKEHRLCLFAGELAEVLGGLAETLEQKLAARPSRRLEAMKKLAPPPLDLTLYNEATRRALYRRVVEEYFTTRQEDDGEVITPPYTPEQAELQVLFFYGRYLVTWWKLEEPEEAPESERRELLLAELDPCDPGRIVYLEL
jgi:hypothetical protein